MAVAAVVAVVAVVGVIAVMAVVAVVGVMGVMGVIVACAASSRHDESGKLGWHIGHCDTHASSRCCDSSRRCGL